MNEGGENMIEVRICGVKPAECQDHVDVSLHAPEADRYLHVRIEGEAGRNLLAELNGFTTPCGRMADALSAALCAAGCVMRQIALRCEDRRLQATLTIETAEGPRTVDVDACAALLAASRHRITVMVPEPARPPTSQLPPVFESFLETLDFGAP
jgi:hypothetical protein